MATPLILRRRRRRRTTVPVPYPEPLAACGGPERMRNRPSVILIREWAEQLTGSGCCGRLEGDFAGCHEGPVFRERREGMERMGLVYRGLKEQFGDAVEIQVVDPRNAALLFLLVRDCWTFRVGFGAGLRMLFSIPKQAVVVNGHLADRTDHPDPRRIAQIVEAQVRRGPTAIGVSAGT